MMTSDKIRTDVLIVIIALALITTLAVIGVFMLTYSGKPMSETLNAIVTVGMGSLGALLASTSSQRRATDTGPTP